MKRRRRVEILARRRAHDGFFALDVLKLRHERFDGSMTPVLDRELFVTRPAVSILPYDPARDSVMLVEQFRTALIDAPMEPWVLEAPAGMLRPGEDAEAAARRELIEETGLEALEIVRALQFWPTPGAVSEFQTLFVAAVSMPATGAVHGLAHEDEDIQTHVLPFAQAVAGLASGAIAGASAVIGILWLQAHRQRLRQLWRPAAGTDA